MQSILKYLPVVLAALTLSLLMSPPAQAHLMVAQHGTLNIVDDGAFMVLSLPVSAFEGIDDNNDGKVSMVELNNHRAAVVESVRNNVVLSANGENRPLQGITLSPVIPHAATHATTALSQLVVMGRFSLDNADNAFRLHVGLYGTQAAEQLLEITATRRSDDQRQVLELTPGTSAGLLFPT